MIISDIAMPGLDGYQLMQALRGGRAADTPVIAFTGFGRANDARHAFEAGFSAHLAKPVTAKRLLRTLLEVLRPRRVGR